MNQNYQILQHKKLQIFTKRARNFIEDFGEVDPKLELPNFVFPSLITFVMLASEFLSLFEFKVIEETEKYFALMFSLTMG